MSARAPMHDRVVCTICDSMSSLSVCVRPPCTSSAAVLTASPMLNSTRRNVSSRPGFLTTSTSCLSSCDASVHNLAFPLAEDETSVWFLHKRITVHVPLQHTRSPLATNGISVLPFLSGGPHVRTPSTFLHDRATESKRERERDSERERTGEEEGERESKRERARGRG